MKGDRPSPGCVILLAILLFLCLAVSLCVSVNKVGADPVYQHSSCLGAKLRAYNGPDGYVRWGRWVTPTADPSLGGWTDYALPLVGHAHLQVLRECRITVNDAQGMLYLDYLGNGAWSLPYVGWISFLPVVGNP